MTPNADPVAAKVSRPIAVAEVFVAFLKLGLTSFGGPIAHLGYFQRELISRRRWLDPAHYAQLVALCQFLPGPASSQLGFSLGLMRAGWWGALAAFTAFTLPSFLLLVGFAELLSALEHPYGRAGIHGLKLLAVAVVAEGVRSMAQRLTPDWPRRSLAVAAAGVILLSGSAVVQLVVVGAGALLGLWVCRKVSAVGGTTFDVPYGVRSGVALLTAFVVLLVIALTIQDRSPSLVPVAAAFYRAGALVFGGGHVVLPLLKEAVVAPGWISTDEFLAGYGAAQAVPGPMFSLAAFLGARLPGDSGGWWAATVSALAIFLPGFLLVAGVLPLWRRIAERPQAARVLAGVNATVVGLLGAALYDPVGTSAIADTYDALIALAAFLLLSLARVPVVAALALCVSASIARVGLG
jgi:chromate transporter